MDPLRTGSPLRDCAFLRGQAYPTQIFGRKIESIVSLYGTFAGLGASQSRGLVSDIKFIPKWSKSCRIITQYWNAYQLLIEVFSNE